MEEKKELNEQKVLLSLKDVWVNFKVRGRNLTAIRGVTMDVYEDEALAIVGESGSGKSVLTKTFTGMLDSNGYISNGSILYTDEELSKTIAKNNRLNRTIQKIMNKKLNEYSKYESSSKELYEIFVMKNERKAKMKLSAEQIEEHEKKIKFLTDEYNDKFNLKMTLNRNVKSDNVDIKTLSSELSVLKQKIKIEQEDYKKHTKSVKKDLLNDKAYNDEYNKKVEKLLAIVETNLKTAVVSDEQIKRNEIVSKEFLLSIARFPFFKKVYVGLRLLSYILRCMKKGVNIGNVDQLNSVFDKYAFRVEYREDAENGDIIGYAPIDLAKIKHTGDWQQIRGRRIATIFQDPMTSLNPIITIGNQIATIIMKHQKCNKAEAKRRTIEIMERVGIDNAKNRINDYPFQYSGGMRQRIVIAIALSCQPKVLICDEPTTALDVTIQAQILDLIKSLQDELHFTTVYITHDLGVVAKVADRVAVLYAGQVVEIGKVEEIFYDPRHPYTWALLSSLPQLARRGETLFSINGTPPSLYNKVVGDAFAPRNKYAMAIDLVKEPPYFSVSPTHKAKTWLLDPRAPKLDKPEIIQDIHDKMSNSFLSMGSTEFED